MISIIIPTNKDPFIFNTLKSLLDNSRSDIEIIPVFDGYTPDKDVQFDSRVKPIFFGQNRGMRAAINAGIESSKGGHIMKCDSHCHFAPAYDKIMEENCSEEWLLIPTRYSLDDQKWERMEDRPIRNYHYLTYPQSTKEYGLCLSNQGYWPERERARKNPKYDIDDTMTFQGSCWFANRKYFLRHVGLLDDRKETYGTFADEPQEIGLKYWLGGGANKVIKKTWYAHLSKRPRHYEAGIFVRDYKIDKQTAKNHTWSAKHWLNNEEPGMVRPFSWLVEKFWPVRTWPEDRTLWTIPKNYK